MDVSTIRGEKRFVKTSHEKVIDKEVEGRRMRMKEGKSKRTRERERETEREKIEQLMRNVSSFSFFFFL